MLSAPVPRPFPGTRIGCDVQSVDVVDEAIRDFGARYLDRVYTPVEQEAGRVGGAPSLAARFAAKEAVLKVLGTTDGVDPRSIEIRSPAGRPEVHLAGYAARIASAARIEQIDVSLSHTGDLAMAVAVGIVPTLHEDRHET